MKMKKILTILILIAILFASLFVLTGCGKKKNENSENLVGEVEDTTEGEEVNGDEISIAIINNLEDTKLTQLYMTNSNEDGWGEDLLNGNVLDYNTQITAFITLGEDNVEWDIQAIKEDGTSLIFKSINLSNINKEEACIILTMVEGNPTAFAK